MKGKGREYVLEDLALRALVVHGVVCMWVLIVWVKYLIEFGK